MFGVLFGVALCLGAAVLSAIKFLVLWWIRGHWTEADLAPLAGGSFLLVTVLHVNGCKNIIRPVRRGRLLSLKTAAAGKRMGVQINQWRILYAIIHGNTLTGREWNRTCIPGHLNPMLLVAREQHRGKCYQTMNACRHLIYLINYNGSINRITVAK